MNHIVTRGYGGKTVVTRGYGQHTFIITVYREIRRFYSCIKRVLDLESKIG